MAKSISKRLDSTKKLPLQKITRRKLPLQKITSSKNYSQKITSSENYLFKKLLAENYSSETTLQEKSLYNKPGPAWHSPHRETGRAAEKGRGDWGYRFWRD